MKYKIILFQKYLRSHILNFRKNLKEFEFVLIFPEESTKKLYQRITTFENETARKKTNFILLIRRILGIPNARLKFFKNGDLIFTYGCLLFTNKPYCVYIENGISIYKYDPVIAKNPLAKFIISFLISRKQCRKLIFMSETAQKSFLSSVNYSPKTIEIIKSKSAQCYPLVSAKKEQLAKIFNGNLRLLFAGTFYMKGGIEVVNAFEKLQKNYPEITLTIITQLGALKKDDLERIGEINGIKLLNAAFNAQQMQEIFSHHDIFVLPTYRDSFGMIMIEVLAYGMPIISTDQYATPEMVIDGYNGFLYFNHPLKDYDENNFKIIGKYYQPKDFYAELFRLQKEGKMQPIEDFLYDSMEKFMLNPKLLEKFSRNSLELYNKKFHYNLIPDRIESSFLEAVEK